ALLRVSGCKGGRRERSRPVRGSGWGCLRPVPRQPALRLRAGATVAVEPVLASAARRAGPARDVEAVHLERRRRRGSGLRGSLRRVAPGLLAAAVPDVEDPERRRLVA